MIIMITGGQRSGKSEFAEQLARSLSQRPVYLATAQVLDEEIGRRVAIHKERRGERWLTIEEPLRIDEAGVESGMTVVVDCVTLWASNWFFNSGEQVDKALDEMKRRFDSLAASGATLLMVTNEVGLGGVADNAMQRRFTDLQGAINRHIASRADEVHFIVSGIDMKIKP